MSNRKALTDFAFDSLVEHKSIMSFAEIFKDVMARSGESNADISQFYTDMSLDGRFLALAGNKWDLKDNHTFEESHINIEDITFEDDDDTDVVVEEDEEGFEQAETEE